MPPPLQSPTLRGRFTLFLPLGVMSFHPCLLIVYNQLFVPVTSDSFEVLSRIYYIKFEVTIYLNPLQNYVQTYTLYKHCAQSASLNWMTLKSLSVSFFLY